MRDLWVKIREAMLSALPIIAIVYVLALTPLFSFTTTEFIAFTAGALLLVFGIALFNLGAEIAMTPMGAHVGSGLSRQKKLLLLLVVCGVLGVLITVAEPDLKVLAEQVSTVMNGTLLIVTVGLGVGMFLVIAVLKIVFRRDLSQLLMLFYLMLFALALMLFVRGKGVLLPVAFDSGGVTTGPITVPFIMALGVGIAGVIGGRNQKENAFGLVALCSIGPMLAVMLLGIFSRGELSYDVPSYSVSENVFEAILEEGVKLCGEVAVALLLIVGFFMLCQIFVLKLPYRSLIRIGIGVIYTYIGLVLFLTGVNIGFMPIGYSMGMSLAKLPSWVIVAFGFVVGVLVVLAEPAIHVLNSQVQDVTGGLISRSSMLVALCIGVGTSIALSMLRIVLDFPLAYYVIPGYLISLALSLFVPPVYTAIAFDSGGVASGPLTSGFILPFAVGACVQLNGAGSVLQDAFGIVSLVAMTPLIAIQLLGFKGIVAEKISEYRAMRRILDADDQQIINFM